MPPMKQTEFATRSRGQRFLSARLTAIVYPTFWFASLLLLVCARSSQRVPLPHCVHTTINILFNSSPLGVRGYPQGRAAGRTISNSRPVICDFFRFGFLPPFAGGSTYYRVAGRLMRCRKLDFWNCLEGFFL